MYTSYFGNIRNLPKDLILISISNMKIDSRNINVYHFPDLTPDYDLVKKYKTGEYSKAKYIRLYNEQLFQYTPKQWIKKILEFLHSQLIDRSDDDIINNLCFLCCESYLKDDEIIFCHRHLFSCYMGAEYDIFEYGRRITAGLIVAGSRDADSLPENKELCFRCIKYAIIKLKRKYNVNLADITIIQGGAKGGDAFGKSFAMKYRINQIQFDADWDTYGKSAGYRRNVDMANHADDFDVSALVAFPGRDSEDDYDISKGTNHMINIAREHNFDSITTKHIDIAIPFK